MNELMLILCYLVLLILIPFKSKVLCTKCVHSIYNSTITYMVVTEYFSFSSLLIKMFSFAVNMSEENIKGIHIHYLIYNIICSPFKKLLSHLVMESKF